MLLSMAATLTSCTDEGETKDEASDEKLDESFDYLTSDLSEYIEVKSEGYKNYTADLHIAKPKPIDPDVEILGLLRSKKGEAKNGGEKVTAGTVSAGDVLDIYYKGYTLNEDGSKNYLDSMCNFASSSAASLEIGSGRFIAGFELDLLGVEFTEENKLTKDGSGNISGTYILVQCYFAYNYNAAELQNKDAYFEVYINGMVDYDAPEFNDAFVDANIADGSFGITEADLSGYEGTSCEKLRAFISDRINKNYENEYRKALESIMWERYHTDAVATVKQYPKTKVDEIYNDYYADIEYQFETSSGYIQNAFGISTKCYKLDDYAIIYLGLEYSENKDWRGVLRNMARDLVKERLIIYSIMRAEDLVPTENELSERVEAIKSEQLENYIEQYLDSYNKDRSDYSDEEWEKFVSDREAELLTYYDGNYYTELAYYETALDSFLKWPTVTTLDDK